MTPRHAQRLTGLGHNSPPLRCHHWAVYRLTCEEYESVRRHAEGCCGICKTPEAETRRGILHVDHFHGQNGVWFIRGMLCGWCNQSVMQCFDGLKPWNPVNRQYEDAAREYERNSWEKPSEEALRQMAARTEMMPKSKRPHLPPRSVLRSIAVPARQGVPAMAERLRHYLTPDELVQLIELLREEA